MSQKPPHELHVKQISASMLKHTVSWLAVFFFSALRCWAWISPINSPKQRRMGLLFTQSSPRKCILHVCFLGIKRRTLSNDQDVTPAFFTCVSWTTSGWRFFTVKAERKARKSLGTKSDYAWTTACLRPASVKRKRNINKLHYNTTLMQTI